MRLSVAARAARLLSAAGLALAVLAPAAGPAVAADPLVLKAGMLQKIDSLNPYGTALVSGYEAYELTYDQLVGFGRNLEPVPAFASSWSRSPDGKSVIFKFRPDLKWSDGQPANAVRRLLLLADQPRCDRKAGENVGLGYLDPSLTDAGVTKVECPDAETMIVSTEDQSDRVFQTYIPILPKHIWGKMDYKAIGDAKFEPPADGSGLVGTGPYQLVEYKQDQFARFVRNPNYWGPQGAADEVILQIFGTNDTMVQALKKGEIDYARNVSADQLKALKNEPNIVGVNGASNGWTELGFNTYGTGTGKTIKGGGPSTKALLDPAFRDALGYAIDKQKLIDNVLGGYGTIGSTQVPPVLAKWHVDPKNPRTFDIELAKQKLDAAGYKLDASGNRLDKEGKPINLRLVMPDDNPNHPKEGQFIQDWFGQLGIKVAPKVYDVGALVDVDAPAGGRRGEQQGRLRPVHLDLVGQSGPEHPRPGLHVRPDRQLVGQQLVQPGVRQALRRPERRQDRRRSATPSSTRCSSSGTTRRRITSCTTTMACTPTGPTSSAGGRTSRPTARRSSPTASWTTRS